MKRLLFIAVAANLLGGCAWYGQQSWTPDTANYTVSVDHQTGETVSYVGVGWSLKGGK